MKKWGKNVKKMEVKVAHLGSDNRRKVKYMGGNTIENLSQKKLWVRPRKPAGSKTVVGTGNEGADPRAIT